TPCPTLTTIAAAPNGCWPGPPRPTTWPSAAGSSTRRCTGTTWPSRPPAIAASASATATTPSPPRPRDDRPSRPQLPPPLRGGGRSLSARHLRRVVEEGLAPDPVAAPGLPGDLLLAQRP